MTMMVMLIGKMTIMLVVKLVVVMMMTITLTILLLSLMVMIQIMMTAIMNMTNIITTVTMMVRIMVTSPFSPGSSPVNLSTQTTVTNSTGFLLLRNVCAGVGDIGRAACHALVGCQEVSKDRISDRDPDDYIGPDALPGG